MGASFNFATLRLQLPSKYEMGSSIFHRNSVVWFCRLNNTLILSEFDGNAFWSKAFIMCFEGLTSVVYSRNESVIIVISNP